MQYKQESLDFRSGERGGLLLLILSALSQQRTELYAVFKNGVRYMGPIIPVAILAHQTPNLMSRNGTSWIMRSVAQYSKCRS